MCVFGSGMPGFGGEAVMGSRLGGSGSDCWSSCLCLFHFVHHIRVKGVSPRGVRAEKNNE